MLAEVSKAHNLPGSVSARGGPRWRFASPVSPAIARDGA